MKSQSIMVNCYEECYKQYLSHLHCRKLSSALDKEFEALKNYVSHDPTEAETKSSGRRESELVDIRDAPALP